MTLSVINSFTARDPDTNVERNFGPGDYIDLHENYDGDGFDFYFGGTLYDKANGHLYDYCNESSAGVAEPGNANKTIHHLSKMGSSGNKGLLL